MQPTRRYWTVAALALVLVGGAVLAQRPVLLVGGAAIGAWLLARQYRFVGHVETLGDGLSVYQAVGNRRVPTDAPISVTLDVVVERPVPLWLTVEAAPPVSMTGSTAEARTVRLAPGDREGLSTFELRSSVAGLGTFDEPTVDITDPAGFFTESLRRGSTPTVTVDPRAPRDVHVGAGGNRMAVAYGDHESGRFGSGLEPAELRQYVAGDAASRIDWKATARLGQLFVREFESETDRQTVVVLDHRATMAQGRDGETKLDYAREVSLGLVEYARSLNDPTGLYTVGDDGITARYAADASEPTYRSIRETVQRLTPTESERNRQRSTIPATARRRAATLGRDDSVFATRLRPFLEETSAYVERIDQDPLFRTTRVHLSRLSGSVLTVIVSDDSNRSELREAVKLARRGDDAVLVLLTPSVLFEPGGLADLEEAYERYLEFEEFRRSLARLDRVQAYEVGPGDRLGAILASRRSERRANRGVTA